MTWSLRSVVCACVLAMACAGGGEPTIPQCEDGIDNDQDGLIDALDPACMAGATLESDDPPLCHDGKDNDGDNLADYPADPGCDSEDDDDESNAPIAQCRDGRDNDADGLADFPADPGCVFADQNDEHDDCPDGTSCPACGNGRDDDMDGKVDYPEDSGCDSASDGDEYRLNVDACGGEIRVERLPDNGQATGMIMVGHSDVSSARGCNGQGNEVVYQVEIRAASRLIASTVGAGTTTDTTLYIRKDCRTPASEIACNDDATPGMGTGSRLVADLDPGVYYLVVDTAYAAAMGNFALTVELQPGPGVACDPAHPVCREGLSCRTAHGNTTPTCENPVCSDGRDDDGDQKMDFPADPGCSSPTDTDEADDCPSGPSCPACANGVDDDMDGHTDFPDDTSCGAASGVTELCTSSEALTVVTAFPINGTTTGAFNDHTPTCAANMHSAPDKLFQLDLPAMTSLSLSASSTSLPAISPVLSMYGASCGGTPISCAAAPATGPAVLTPGPLTAGTYYLVVDGKTTDAGSFTVTATGVIAADGTCGTPLLAGFTCAVGSACTPVAGGTGSTCRPTACNDHIDQDGDGRFGYPDDPGCTSVTDTDETDDCPSGPNCPACANGRDDDMDGATDYPADTVCSAASGATELGCPTEHDPILMVTAGTTMGTTAGLANDQRPSCGTSNAPEQVYLLSLPQPVQKLIVDTFGSAYDTILSVTDPVCTTPAMGCNDDSGGSASKVELTNVAAGAYALIVDGYQMNAGMFTLHVRGEVPPGAACTSPLFAAGVLFCSGTQTCQAGVCAAP